MHFLIYLHKFSVHSNNMFSISLQEGALGEESLIIEGLNESFPIGTSQHQLDAYFLTIYAVFAVLTPIYM